MPLKLRLHSLITLVIASASLFSASIVYALQALDDTEMSGVSGGQLAYALEDFRFQMAPTSYIEQIGRAPTGATVFNRGDLRWFGLAITGTTGTGEVWTNAGGHTCGAGFLGMGCPINQSATSNYAPDTDPFTLGVQSFTAVGSTNLGASWVTGINATVFQLQGPDAVSDFLWSFWGETQSSKGGITNGSTGGGATVARTLQNQVIIRGTPTARTNPNSGSALGPTLQMFQSQTDGSLGLLYHSRLSGDFRFSVNQIAGGPSGGIPRFTDQEGLYFTDVEAYLPLGQLYYQSVILDNVALNDGNFVIELTRLPDDADAYNDLYSAPGGNGYARTGRSSRYYETHGYVRWGNAFPTCGGSNCLSGSGVNTTRFSGTGYNGANYTQTLSSAPAIAVTQANYPNGGYEDDPTAEGLCGGGQDSACDRWLGDTTPAIAAQSFTFSSAPVTSANSRSDIASAPGISFLSRSGGSWTVVNNQNSFEMSNDIVFNAVYRRHDVAQARTNRDTVDCGFFCTDERVRADTTPDINAIRSAALDVFNNKYGGASPRVSVNAINLGAGRVEGLLVQHLKITSLGAN